jgi:hypothetical protein
MIMPFGFGIFSIDNSGRYPSDIISEVVTFEPGMVPMCLVEVPVHIIERGLGIAVRRTGGKYILHVIHGPDRRSGK